MGANGVTRQDEVMDPGDPRIAASVERHMDWLEARTPYTEELLELVDRYLPGIAGFQLLIQVDGEYLPDRTKIPQLENRPAQNRPWEEVPLPFEQDNDGGGCV